NHRVIWREALRLLDVGGPAGVAIEWIDRQSDNSNTALFKLRLDLGHVAKFSGAHRREVLRVGEQHGPGIADPVVEADITFGGLRLKIRRNVIDCKGHHTPPS